MKIAIAIEGLLCEAPFAKYTEEYYMKVKPFSDVRSAALTLTECSERPLFFTESPSNMLTVVRAWLKCAGFPEANYEDIVTNVIKRFDCRMHEVDVFIDADRSALKTFIYDSTRPVYVDRLALGPVLNGLITNYDYLDEAVNDIIKTT